MRDRYTQESTADGPAFLEEYEGSLLREYQLTRLYRLFNGELLRVRTRYELYQEQSHAVAELFSSHRTWTILLEDLADRWHPELRTVAAALRPAALGEIATGLAKRANTLLLHLQCERDQQPEPVQRGTGA
jgi:hypothetical protein